MVIVAKGTSWIDWIIPKASVAFFFFFFRSSPPPKTPELFAVHSSELQHSSEKCLLLYRPPPSNSSLNVTFLFCFCFFFKKCQSVIESLRLPGTLFFERHRKPWRPPHPPERQIKKNEPSRRDAHRIIHPLWLPHCFKRVQALKLGRPCFSFFFPFVSGGEDERFKPPARFWLEQGNLLLPLAEPAFLMRTSAPVAPLVEPRLA